LLRVQFPPKRGARLSSRAKNEIVHGKCQSFSPCCWRGNTLISTTYETSNSVARLTGCDGVPFASRTRERLQALNTLCQSADDKEGRNRLRPALPLKSYFQH